MRGGPIRGGWALIQTDKLHRSSPLVVPSAVRVTGVRMENRRCRSSCRGRRATGTHASVAIPIEQKPQDLKSHSRAAGFASNSAVEVPVWEVSNFSSSRKQNKHISNGEVRKEKIIITKCIIRKTSNYGLVELREEI